MTGPANNGPMYNPQNYSVGGVQPRACYAGNVGTTLVTVVTENKGRIGRLEFINPSTVNISISPKYDSDGNELSPVYGGAGSIIVYAGGALVTIQPPATSAWKAIAASGSANPFTVLEY